VKKFVKIIALGLIILALVIGCTGPQKEPKTPEQIAQEKYAAFEKDAIEAAKEFVLAIQENKDKIKELSFPTLLKEIEDKNWSIMLVDEIKIKPDTLETTTEKLGDNQVLVRVFYEGEMTVEGKTIPVKLSNKLGVIKMEERPVVFSFE